MKNQMEHFPVTPMTETVRLGESLNVLGGAHNHAEQPQTLEITLWGRSHTQWKALVTKTFTLQPDEHKHLYYNIPAQCFSPRFWGQTEADEIELVTSCEEPSADTNGVLAFVV